MGHRGISALIWLICSGPLQYADSSAWAGERNTCMLDLVHNPRYNKMNRQTFTWWIMAFLQSMDLPAEHITPAVAFSQWLWKWKQWHKSEPGPLTPWAGICCKLSDAVRSNSDWWEIRKTDCMGWWTAVSQINLAISDPAELTIVRRRAASISDSGSYSASVTHVSEMSTESWKSQCSAVQAKICVKWCENFQTK